MRGSGHGVRENPGIASVSLTFLLKDKSRPVSEQKRPFTFVSFIHYWQNSPPAYRKLLIGLLAFALFNSSDVFLLLKVKQAGLSDTTVIGLYILYNLVYAVAAYPLGHLGDRLGLKTVFIAGLAVFSLVYGGMAFTNGLYIFCALFFLYGIFAAATEGIAKAWISNIVSSNQTATAIGTYTAFQSICTMIASSLAGVLWLKAGAEFTFLLSAIVVVGVIIYFLLQRELSLARVT